MNIRNRAGPQVARAMRREVWTAQRTMRLEDRRGLHIAALSALHNSSNDASQLVLRQ
jgi:hypothetical protein